MTVFNWIQCWAIALVVEAIWHTFGGGDRAIVCMLLSLCAMLYNIAYMVHKRLP